MVAAFRAMESARPDALFKDPLAQKLSGEHGQHIIDNLPSRAFLGGWTVVIRTGIIDSFIESALRDGVDTILNLGAGLDTRPYRMNLPSNLKWIEVDYPHMIDFKNEKLAGETPHCQLQRVGMDLADLAARKKFLREACAPAKKVLVLTEGVTPYLSNDAVTLLGKDLHAESKIQYWIADYFSAASLKYRKKSGMAKSMKNAPFLFEPPDYFALYAEAGWNKKEIRYFVDESKRVNRPAPFPLMIRVITTVTRFLAAPEKRKAMSQFAGFVLFERS